MSPPRPQAVSFPCFSLTRVRSSATKSSPLWASASDKLDFPAPESPTRSSPCPFQATQALCSEVRPTEGPMMARSEGNSTVFQYLVLSARLCVTRPAPDRSRRSISSELRSSYPLKTRWPSPRKYGFAPLFEHVSYTHL